MAAPLVSFTRAALMACLGLGVTVGAVIWELLAHPAPWVLAWAALCAAAAAKFGRGLVRTVAVNTGVLCLLLIPVELMVDGGAPPGAASRLAAAESAVGDDWREVEAQGALRIQQRGGTLVRSSPAGFITRPSATVHERMQHGDQWVYDVTYHTDAYGFRVTTSPHRAALPPDAPVVIFAGCSFTFGQGVEDHETLPSQFEAASGARVRAINWSSVGGAAHLLLAQLQAGLDAPLPRVERVVHVAIRHHLQRITGWAPWSPGYPHFVLDGSGGVVRDGSFLPWELRAARDPALRLRLGLHKSAIARTLWERLPSALGIADDDAATLMVALLTALQSEVRARWQAPLTVVLWDDFGPETTAVVEGLRAAGVDVLTHAEAMPEFDASTYYLPNYPHPSALANARLGETLARRFAQP